MKKKKAGKKNRKSNDNLTLLYLFIGAALLLSAALYKLASEDVPRSVAGTDDKKTAIEIAPAIPVNIPEAPKPLTEDSQAEQPLPKLAIIIDDIGFNENYLDLIKIGVPLTLAVIPSTKHVLDAAEAVNAAGLELMMHLPMEPKGYPETDPGRWALLTNMEEQEIARNLDMNFKALSAVKGVNNHMGSSFTEYGAGMRVVLEEIKKRGLFFVDSRTSYRSKGFSIARDMGIKSAERSVFLDNVQTRKAISRQIAESVKAAKEKGKAIAIGHPSRATISTLADLLPHMKDDGVELVFASAIVD